ncbi:hypothetical protein B0T16DRAFT_457672 [Cercophora newfieldiana]|uniref:Uncharacterized protein n=1 Tax=Cercophora newfieldiana TaxID=92897 RepID=A0AA39Y494_9PEZI|nr:hypothetical protein B0T16DRAFT_457672 [Cercophora newfieldiana]
MLSETYASWLQSISACCGRDEKPRRGVADKPIVILRDQPAFVPPPSAEPLWSSENAYEKSLGGRSVSGARPSSSWSRGTVGTPWFSRSSSSRRRPKISGPSNFRHLHSESFQFPEQPQPTQKRFSFRPLELGFEGEDKSLSPLLPYFEDGNGDGYVDRESQITPPPRAHTAASSKWDGSSATLGHDRSYSSMSFHIPRRHGPVREGSISSENPITPPRIPVKSRARAQTSPTGNVDQIVERIASALIEKERLQSEIESIIERQSIYINSRPSTAYGIPELEPMPSIPALPDAGPSFAERLSSDGRPHTAPTQGINSTNNTNTHDDMPPRDLATAAFNSHPPFARTHQDFSSSPIQRNLRYYDDRYLERPLAPPLPLVLRPPLRKKKSFSRVSSWLFPDGVDSPPTRTRRDMSVNSVTNAPRPIRGNEGFYQPATVGSGRGSVDSDVSSLRTWETTTTEEEEEERQTVPTTTMSSPVVQSTPRETPVAKFTWGYAQAQASGGGGVKVQGPRPQSVGVAF